MKKSYATKTQKKVFIKLTEADQIEETEVFSFTIVTDTDIANLQAWENTSFIK